VWRAYGAQPITGPHDSVSHASALEFISPSGKLRGLASYDAGSANAPRWGYALASVVEQLLGTHAQMDAHALRPAPTAAATAAPTFSLPALGTTRSPPVSLGRLRGRLAVLNFFASWCSACQAEAPGLASAAQSLPAKASLVGVDINDSRSAAQAFVKRYHLGYPIGFDAQGDVAAAYGVSGLPTTVFVSPEGRVVARHVGAISRAALIHQVTQLLAHP
jgi:thiol-disulfide isomerase/thioredoxin